MRSAALALSLAALPVLAGQPLSYADGATKLAGYLSHPADAKGKVPGVVVIHQWMGLTDHERKVSDDLAKLGYAALAADIYGEGVRPANTGEAGKLAGSFKGDRALYRRRIAAAIETLKAQKGVDGSRIAVIGFCFGGTGAIEAARGGLPVKAVVSFHGGLDVPAGYAPGPMSAKVLVCHGADDPWVPAKDVAAFQDEMRQAKADYVFVAYAGAVHAFTQKEAGSDNSKGAAYNEAAHRRSWQHMKDFFHEAL
ncbi:MAG: dienelactone hydrolase family protein [Geothrix sp.]|uniref:dienelactone hydrolase family protein n=1 Tax=Geothrix sp. TaxID=1962974 RepID=UPI0017F0A084|nr:dienelactone hydrolase family protein [Geothrix sp.]NWJ41856.1 dienelactone hydrolase family protein [Geothrix sp.]WIL20169.1 MAG: dienelactone hydrolase family protein [Geothrix sp.]